MRFGARFLSRDPDRQTAGINRCIAIMNRIAAPPVRVRIEAIARTNGYGNGPFPRTLESRNSATLVQQH